ncbi:ABC-2 type transport system permease protein [Haloechinothrix alba]|uniref:ABC-2 type transport system permease protein n=1 Tax=Haloechinothrix alba TaxID=664784 RepID=A0A238VL47_9PSEU|nr:ABC transporter permease [Haloechinothrix alba]SNR35085.1 ABC-2 type transport system permease protein [Haloechinothrix alba]
MATITAPAPAAARGGDRRPLAGVGALARFALRRDRIRIPAWIAGLTLGSVVNLVSFEDLYPTEADREAVAETMNTPAGLAMTGPAEYLRDYTAGAMMGHQLLGFTALLAALMSVLMVVRHTRAEEESGRAELVRATVVGRHAHMAAALGVVIVTNLVLAVVLAGALAGTGGTGVTATGSLLYGLAHAAVGIVFAGIAAVTVQITEHSRGASGMGLAAIAVAYALRAAGDIGEGGLSWLSPIGWAQATRVYVDDRWWPLLVAAAAAAALVTAGVLLSTRRDVGAGLRRPRQGRGYASVALGHPIGLAVRLHRGLLIGFAAALALLGTMYGSILSEVEDMLAGVEMLEEALAEMGGASIVESFVSMVMVVLAVIASVYVVLAALRPRAEESDGRAEPVLATAVSRARWLAGHVVVGMLGGVVVLAAGGLGLGLAGALALRDSAVLTDAMGAALAYAPALWLTGGLAVALFGLAPRLATLTWVVPVYGFVVSYLGGLLQFPEWMNNLSPFGHVPDLPAEELSVLPLLLLTAIAAGLALLGLTAFRQRDLQTDH